MPVRTEAASEGERDPGRSSACPTHQRHHTSTTVEAPGREARRIPATERTLPSGIVYQIVQSLDGQSEAFQAGSLPRHGQCLGMSAVVVTLVAGGAQTSGVERPIRMARSGFWHLNTLTKQYCICVQELRRSEAQPMQRVGQCRELIQSGTRPNVAGLPGLVCGWGDFRMAGTRTADFGRGWGWGKQANN